MQDGFSNGKSECRTTTGKTQGKDVNLKKTNGVTDSALV